MDWRLNMIKCTLEQIYNNAIYISIAHALFTFREPFFSFEHSWDDMNYCFNYGSIRGTVSFDFEHSAVVGAARNENILFNKSFISNNSISLFQNSSNIVMNIAKNETLEYLYYDSDGKQFPVATVGFWNDDDYMILSENIESFDNDGGSYFLELFKSESLFRDYAINQYKLDRTDMDLVELIYTNIRNKNFEIILPTKYHYIFELEGAEEGMESLLEIGVSFKLE